MEFVTVSYVLLTLVESVNFCVSTPIRAVTSTTALSRTTEFSTTTKLSSLPELTTAQYSSQFPESLSSAAIPAMTKTTTRIPVRHCCASIITRQRKRHLVQMSMGLEEVPEGYPETHVLHIAYNNIADLPEFVFWNNSFSGLRKAFLQHNRIRNVSVNAFKGLRQIKQIDLSDNLIEIIDPYTFKANSRLQKLILVNNLIFFNRLHTFVLSHSLEHLVLSNNRIDQVYEMTFLGVPNLRSLVLGGNDVFSIAPNSFRTLRKLHYLSLANTGVYRLGESMFSQTPRTLCLEGTPLASRFEPPLTRVTGESVAKLLSLSRLLVDENYFPSK